MIGMIVVLRGEKAVRLTVDLRMSAKKEAELQGGRLCYKRKERKAALRQN